MSNPVPQRIALWLFFVAIALATVTAQEIPREDPLYEASLRGDAAKVVKLIGEGADVDRAKPHFGTPLHVAATRGNIEVMKLLIKAGADVNFVDPNGWSVFAVGAANDRARETLQLLIDSGAKPDPSALDRAARRNEPEVVTFLLDLGIPPGAGLATAAQSRNLELVKQLLDLGGDVNYRSKGGYTALHLGATQGGREVVKLLLDRGADPNLADDSGNTPLHKAVTGDGDARIVEMLVRADARLNLANNEGVTPVRLAAQRGGGPVYALLLAAAGGKEPDPVAALPIAGQLDMRTSELFDQLLGTDYPKRRDAQKQLALRGREVIPEAMQRIQAGAPLESFIDLFAAIGPGAEPALPVLVDKLGEPTSTLGALIAMERIKPGFVRTMPDKDKARAAESLYVIIIDPKADVMGGFAANFLMTLGDPAAPTILKLLRDEHPGLRAGTARRVAGSRYSHASVTEVLANMMKADVEPAVRTEAAAAIKAIEPASTANVDEARAELVRILKSSPPANASPTDIVASRKLSAWRSQMDRAARSLGQFGPDVIEDLIPLLSPMNNPNRTGAIQALVSIGPPAVPRLIQLMAHDEDAVAVSASVALNRIGPASAPALGEALGSSNEKVVRHALNALWWIGRGARETTPAVLAVVRSDQQPDAVRTIALRTALKVDPELRKSAEVVEAAMDAAVRTLQTGTFAEQGVAAETLGLVGPAARDALPLLRERLKMPDATVDTGILVRDYVSREAALAIEAIEGGAAK